jgi:multidrug efflux system membrane fusion protein
MTRGLKRALAIAAAASLLLAGVLEVAAQQDRRRAPAGSEQAVPVLAAEAKAMDVPVYLQGVGTVQAFNTVTVRAQVDGKLVKVAFQEGQEVKKGDLLAQIDPAIYQAQLGQAEAKKAQDEAQLANARLDLVRYTRLAQQVYGSQQQADTQRALVAQLEAQTKSDQAAIDSAKTYLGYTSITAPIDGRTGIRLVDEGNIVHAADATGIVVIAQLHPISVVFTLPQQHLAAINKAASAGSLPVDALGGDNRTVLDSGKLQVVDNQVDQTTGTIKLKGTFPNAQLQLWPGQFVNVRLLIDTRRGAIVVPSAAVQQGPNGAFVYVVGKDGKAAIRPVTIAQQDEARAVVASGLQSGETVVTSGFVRLTEGTSVTIAKPEAPPSSSAKTP